MKNIVFSLLFFFLISFVSAQVVTDKNVYLPPTPPILPAKGNKFIDPTFGTTILRVTDATDGAINTHAYSYWLTMNNKSSLLYIFSVAGQATIYDFDTVSFSISNKRNMFSALPGMYTEDATWSAKKNNIMLCHGGTKLFEYDAVMDTSSLLHDFSSDMPNEYLWQMSRSEDDNTFAFSRRSNSDYSFLGYLVYTRSSNTVYKADLAGLDEVQVDKDGKYLVIKTGKQGPGLIEVEVLDLQTKNIEYLTDDGPDFAPGHSDNGHGAVAGADNWNNALTFRNLAAPHVLTQIFNWGNDWTNGIHISFHSNDENWVTATMIGGEGLGSGLYKNEIFQIATDGSTNVRRLAHHHSLYKSYWDSPRGSISMDGKYITFASNWGDTTRDDVFVLKVPSYPPTGTFTPTKSNSDFTIYPNPASENEKIYLKNNFDSAIEVKIVNTFGQLVFDANYSSNPLIEISHGKLASGVYTIQLIGKAGVYCKRLIVE